MDEDRGAHGPFDGIALASSPQYELAKHRGVVLAGAAHAGVAGAVALTAAAVRGRH
ncbi:MAG TPA: hypothetical protein VGF81_16485 [Solirubrobacteraceae bacterium]